MTDIDLASIIPEEFICEKHDHHDPETRYGFVTLDPVSGDCEGEPCLGYDHVAYEAALRARIEELEGEKNRENGYLDLRQEREENERLRARIEELEEEKAATWAVVKKDGLLSRINELEKELSTAREVAAQDVRTINAWAARYARIEEAAREEAQQQRRRCGTLFSNSAGQSERLLRYEFASFLDSIALATALEKGE